MKNHVWAFVIPAVILMAVFLVPSLLTSQSAVMDKPSKEDAAHKMQSIQIPFVANNGQVAEQVRFRANTFGGTVFVTKDGEIVSSSSLSPSAVVRTLKHSHSHYTKGDFFCKYYSIAFAIHTRLAGGLAQELNVKKYSFRKQYTKNCFWEKMQVLDSHHTNRHLGFRFILFRMPLTL